MDKVYYSVDVELSGRTVGRDSMISLGAVVVNNRAQQFYREIKPISHSFTVQHMRAASMGLECLTSKLKKIPFYNPEHRDFKPNLVLKVLNQFGAPPLKVMEDFINWVESTCQQGAPVLVAKPIHIDIPVIGWYLEKFRGSTAPFESGESVDLEESYRVLMDDRSANIKSLGVADNRPRIHNALDDAFLQAEQYERILEQSRKKAEQ